MYQLNCLGHFSFTPPGFVRFGPSNIFFIITHHTRTLSNQKKYHNKEDLIQYTLEKKTAANNKTLGRNRVKTYLLLSGSQNYYKNQRLLKEHNYEFMKLLYA